MRLPRPPPRARLPTGRTRLRTSSRPRVGRARYHMVPRAIWSTRLALVSVRSLVAPCPLVTMPLDAVPLVAMPLVIMPQAGFGFGAAIVFPLFRCLKAHF
jgi:hypothetical protein